MNTVLSHNSDKGQANNVSNVVVQASLQLGAVNDPLEHEANAIAEQVMRMPENGLVQRKCSDCEEEDKAMRKPLAPYIQRKGAHGGIRVSESVSNRIYNSKGKGSSFSGNTKGFMESRFGTEFSNVNIHTGREAAQLSQDLGAKAFTVGNDIYFNSGQYAPNTNEGKQLLAHELTHTIQQNGESSRSINRSKQANFIQRAPTINVLDSEFVGPPNTNQRRAAASCPIYSNGLVNMGTLHSMGLFYHNSRGAPQQSPTGAENGVGTSLHFEANGLLPAFQCSDIKIIQVISTTHPAAGRNGGGYVDNAGRNTPFYGDVYLSGSGEHAIPNNYPDAGERIATTHSIYDRPFRRTAGQNTDIQWEAEANVVCVKNNGPDHVMGGVEYGFRLPYNTATNSHDTIQGIGPSCRRAPSGNFIRTLRTDPSIPNYNFTAELGLGDFPVPDREAETAIA